MTYPIIGWFRLSIPIQAFSRSPNIVVRKGGLVFNGLLEPFVLIASVIRNKVQDQLEILKKNLHNVIKYENNEKLECILKLQKLIINSGKHKLSF